MPGARPQAAVFVLVTIFIDAMGFGLIMPVLPQLLMEVGRFGLSDAIEIGAWMGLSMALASFFAAPLLGNISDAVGRRPVLLASLGCLALDQLLLAVAHTLPLVFIARTLAGAFGGSYATAQAAMSDLTPPEGRARAFGFVSAAFGVGFVLGPVLGGLLGTLGPRAPFYASAALCFLNLLYGWFVFPETLPRERRRPFTLARANPLGALRIARRTPGMGAVLVVLTLWQIASLVYPLTWSFWAIAQLGWSSQMIGASLAGVGLVIALSQTLLTGPLVKRLGERDAATLGLVFAIGGFIAYAFVQVTWLAFATMAFIALQSLVQPSLMALMSRKASADTQGEVQGISSMAMGIGSLVAPLALTGTMAHFTGPDAPVHFPGAAFLVAAGFGLAALVLLRRLPQVTA